MRASLALFALLPCVALAQSGPAVPPAAEPAAYTEPTPQSPRTDPVPAPEEPKRKGQFYSWLAGGTTFAYGNTYGNVSLGAGYILPSGIAPNAELGYAFGGDPSIWTFRPGLTYFLPVPVISPYIGVFYTRWFVGGNLPDQNGVGGRAGFSLGRFISLGVVYDHMLSSCGNDCDSWSPVLSGGASF